MPFTKTENFCCMYILLLLIGDKGVNNSNVRSTTEAKSGYYVNAQLKNYNFKI